jgi:hypothetical protein
VKQRFTGPLAQVFNINSHVSHSAIRLACSCSPGATTQQHLLLRPQRVCLKLTLASCMKPTATVITTE